MDANIDKIEKYREEYKDLNLKALAIEDANFGYSPTNNPYYNDILVRIGHAFRFLLAHDSEWVNAFTEVMNTDSKDAITEFSTVFIPKAGSLWLVTVEGRHNVIRVCETGEGFYIPGQEPCWAFSHVDTWLREITV